ncbi:hypothetical protein IQ02_02353 [Flavobacterium glaciei]|uniref:Uncharacterized protein n=1 Tax=Flavobacterium glaciei TaxID=386300 RepID=A0A562PLA0_9FLAO|nr:hypothetical protein DFR66_11351 [Flavobacterium glaciei]TWI45158.1 hypothetical protein IQ02_02353 [Flavobacterium glaciei]
MCRFLKHIILFLQDNLSRYSLYPRPKAWDAAAIGAILGLLFLKKI